MRTFRTILAIIALALITLTLIAFDYKDFSWQANKDNYLRIISMSLLLSGMIIDNILNAKKRIRT